MGLRFDFSTAPGRLLIQCLARRDAVSIGSTIEAVYEGCHAEWDSFASLAFEGSSTLSRIERLFFFFQSL
jgi:hypothetical protein